MSAQGVRNLQGQRRRKEKGGGKRRQRCVLQKELPSTFTRVYFISVACASGVTSSYSSSGSYAFVLPFLSRRGRKLARRVHTSTPKIICFIHATPTQAKQQQLLMCKRKKFNRLYFNIFRFSLALPLFSFYISLSLFVQSFYFDFMTPNVFESSKKTEEKLAQFPLLHMIVECSFFPLLCCRHLALCICKHIHGFYRWRHLRTKKESERGREITVVGKEFPPNVKSLEKMLEMVQPQRKLI